MRRSAGNLQMKQSRKVLRLGLFLSVLGISGLFLFPGPFRCPGGSDKRQDWKLTALAGGKNVSSQCFGVATNRETSAVYFLQPSGGVGAQRRLRVPMMWQSLLMQVATLGYWGCHMFGILGSPSWQAKYHGDCHIAAALSRRIRRRHAGWETTGRRTRRQAGVTIR